MLPVCTHLNNVGSHQSLHQVQQCPLQVGISSNHHGQSLLDGEADVRLLLNKICDIINPRVTSLLSIEERLKETTI